MKTFVFTDSNHTFFVEYLCSGLGDTDSPFTVSEIRGLDTLEEQGVMTFQNLVYSKKAFIDCANDNNFLLLEIDNQSGQQTWLVGSMEIATLSGTVITGGVTEAEIVAGGGTLIITLAENEWHDDIGDDNARTTALIAGITGGDVGSHGWDDEVIITHAEVVRTSDTVVTITLPTAASYAVDANETVSVVIPKEALATSKLGVFTCTNDVLITAIITVGTTSGTAIAGGVLESEIVAGGQTVIITLSGYTWVATVGDDNAITTALIAGFVGSDTGDHGWNDEVVITHTNVVRTSATIVTITLPTAASYAITTNETVTITIPKEALVGGVESIYISLPNIVITANS